ncbi:MAG: DUF302 domain-containing protein [Gammaproteobacteria bacterium]|nr:DUF302 domain-containing protein [Gammaproteobacteria bacterium]
MSLKKIITVLISCLLCGFLSLANGAQEEVHIIEQQLYKVPLAQGIKPADAVDALKSKAIELNMKLVSHQPLSAELIARGIDSRRIEIFQFCNPYDARVMVKHNPIFAAYMPCKIALVEDENKQHWLMMISLDVLINKNPLPLVVKKTAERVNKTLKTILRAGAAGNF